VQRFSLPPIIIRRVSTIWKGHDPASFEAAFAKAREWDYNGDAPIALGTFFKRNSPVFEGKTAARTLSTMEREQAVREVLKKRT